MSGIGGRFYDENEAEEILRLAARDSSGGRLDRERLLSMAAELGITPEAVERAEGEVQRKRQEEALVTAETRDRAEYRRIRRREAWSSLGSYVGINAFLIGIWFLTSRGGGHFWPVWVMFGWGFGIFPGSIRGLFGGSAHDFQKWRAKRDAKELGKSRLPSEEVTGLLRELASRSELTRIEVIKELRERTGLPLTEAKSAVEQYAATHDEVVW